MAGPLRRPTKALPGPTSDDRRRENRKDFTIKKLPRQCQCVGTLDQSTQALRESNGHEAIRTGSVDGLRSCMLRIGQQRLVAGLRCLGDHGAAVVVARHGKTRRHIVAQERDFGALGTIRKRQCAPRLIAIR